MKKTGMVRKIDELGRIVIPKELRKVLGLDNFVPLEIFVSDDQVILQKYMPGCIICDSEDDLHKIENKNICKNCLLRLGDMSS